MRTQKTRTLIEMWTVKVMMMTRFQLEMRILLETRLLDYLYYIGGGEKGGIIVFPCLESL